MARRKTQKPKPTPELLRGRIMLTVAEYSALTGTPRPTVYRYLETGVIPAIRVGRSVRISVAEVQAQLAGNGQAA